MDLKPFQFQEFQICQSSKVFRVGTDGVLLGALANCKDTLRVLEAGSGTGVISLMLAQRNKIAQITAIDIDMNAVELSGQNFQLSPFSSRLETKVQDFKTFRSLEKYDLIVSNPPFFLENNSEKDRVARQRVHLDFFELFQGAKDNLSTEGRLSLIVPFESKREILDAAKNFGFFLERIVEIKGIEKGPVVRLIMEFRLFDTATEKELLTLEEQPRKYTKEYLELTRDFHVFGKKNK